MKKTVAALMLGLTLALVSLTAHAETTSTWRLTNHTKSYTGAIFHLIRNDHFVGQSRTVEPGAPQIKMSLSTTNADRPSGLKVWQPANACLRVYEKIGPIWVRVYRYWSRDTGKDQWVTKETSDAGSKLRVKITRHRCPYQKRLV